MAKRITLAKIDGKNIEFIENNQSINVTDNLKPICDVFFEEEPFLEDGDEEIFVATVHHKDFKNLSDKLEYACDESYEQYKKTKGNEAKMELVSAMRDFDLFKTLIINLLMLAESKEVVLAII